jgi:hypothetical protein
LEEVAGNPDNGSCIVPGRYANPLRILAMSYSTYAPVFKVPDGFPGLLAELTTEILRARVEGAAQIYQFALEFFLKKQQGGGEAAPADGS